MAERQAIAQISRQPYEHETKHGTRTKMQKKHAHGRVVSVVSYKEISDQAVQDTNAQPANQVRIKR